MRRRLLLSYLALAMVVLVALELPLGISFARRERDNETAAVQRDATALAVLAEEGVEHPEGHDLTSLARRYGVHSGASITIVGAGGAVIASYGSTEGSDETEPVFPVEVAPALAGRTAHGRHHDDRGSRQYLAVPIGTDPARGAVLVTYPSGPVDRRIRLAWLELAGLALAVLAVAAAVGLRLARSLTRPLRHLEATASTLAAGDLDARARVDGPPEMAALATALNDMASRLGQLIGAQHRFVADASHQLRSPLTALRLRLENLASTLPTSSTADAESAMAETERLSRLVDGLLALTRAEGVRSEREPIDVGAVVEERKDAWAPLADERHAMLRSLVPAEPVWASAVPGHLEQILDNVLSNALDVTPAGSAVVMQVTALAPSVLIEVTDEGPGLSAEQRMRAFDRFWRGPQSLGHGSSGLGLAIVHQLVLACGGEVELRDGPNERGLQVSLSFNRTADPRAGGALARREVRSR